MDTGFTHVSSVVRAISSINFRGGIQIKRRHEYTSTVYRITVGVSKLYRTGKRENTFGMELIASEVFQKQQY